MRHALVIGGGLAGACAALAFGDAGWQVTLAEARDRPGGRAHSTDWAPAGGPVDLGGSWVRADHSAIRGLADRLGQPLVPRPALRQHRRVPPLPAADAAALAAALSAGPDGPDQTLDAFMRSATLPAAARRELLAWWAISGAGDPAMVAAAELVTPKVRDGLVPRKLEELAFTFAHGAQALVAAAIAASGARLRLGDAVTALADTGRGVTARTAAGHDLQADVAVLAVPLNTLRDIALSPPLSAPQARLAARGHAGRTLKLVIRTRGVAPGTLATGDAGGLMWLWADRALPGGATLVIAFAPQDAVADPAAAARAAIPAAFPGAVAEDAIWHDWCADPCARGTWIAPFADVSPLHAPAVWPARGRVALAGSDIGGDEAGWFEAAVTSGRAAAAALA